MEQAEILTRLRKEKGLSQTEAAEELGVTRQAISKWESGRAFPSMEKLIALSLFHKGMVLHRKRTWIYGGQHNNG